MTSSCCSSSSTCTCRKPRFDKAALDSTVGSLQSYIDDPTSDPDLASYVAYSRARFGQEPRFHVIPTQDELTGLDLETIERVWRQRFTNPGDWVFALSGDFDLDDVTDLARRYFGTLTGSGATEQFKDFQIDPPVERHHRGRARRHRRQGLADIRLERCHSGAGHRHGLCRCADERAQHPPHRPHP